MKAIRRNLSLARKAAQKGFTLIELAIVGLFLGLLAVFAISQFSGSATDTTRANGLSEAAQKVSDNWALVAQTCGLSSDVTSIALSTNTSTTAAANAAANLSVLVGNTAPAAALTGCFNQSGVRPLGNLTTGAAGSEAIQGYGPVTLTSGTVNGRTAMLVNIPGVPETVVLSLYNKLSSVAGASTATTVPATADTTDPSIRFGTATGGKRTVTLVRSL